MATVACRYGSDAIRCRCLMDNSPEVLRQGIQWQAACQNGQFDRTRLQMDSGQLTFIAGSP
jgi:hypothetical protein